RSGRDRRDLRVVSPGGRRRWAGLALRRRRAPNADRARRDPRDGAVPLGRRGALRHGRDVRNLRRPNGRRDAARLRDRSLRAMDRSPTGAARRGGRSGRGRTREGGVRARRLRVVSLGHTRDQQPERRRWHRRLLPGAVALRARVSRALSARWPRRHARRGGADACGRRERHRALGPRRLPSLALSDDAQVNGSFHMALVTGAVLAFAPLAAAQDELGTLADALDPPATSAEAAGGDPADPFGSATSFLESDDGTWVLDDGVGFEELPWDTVDHGRAYRPRGFAHLGAQLRVAALLGTDGRAPEGPLVELSGFADFRYRPTGPWRFR